MKIREAQKKDVNELYALGKKIRELSFSKKLHFHEKLELAEFIKNSKENIFLVAEDKKELIGFLFAKILSHHAGGWCMLDNLAVEQKHRKKGVGTKLLRELYKRIKKKKIHYIQILEEEHHKKTRAFWKSKGYKETTHFVWAEKIV